MAKKLNTVFYVPGTLGEAICVEMDQTFCFANCIFE